MMFCACGPATMALIETNLDGSLRSLDGCTVPSSVRVTPVQHGASLTLKMGPSCGWVTLRTEATSSRQGMGRIYRWYRGRQSPRETPVDQYPRKPECPKPS